MGDGDQTEFALKVIISILVAVFLILPLMELVIWIWKKYRGED